MNIPRHNFPESYLKLYVYRIFQFCNKYGICNGAYTWVGG